MATDSPGPIPIFRFVGHSGSGKTTLLESVIAELVRRSLRVAVVKDTHHEVEFDQPGKDSWRLARAGAAQVLLATNRQLTLIQSREARATLAEVAALVAPRADVLLAEGFRHDTPPAILIWRAALNRGEPPMSGPIIATVGDPPPTTRAPHFAFDPIQPLVDHLLHLGSPAISPPPTSLRADS